MSSRDSVFGDLFPYADRYGVIREFPEHGRPREEILAELGEIAAEEDAHWETGRCSGTMYSGDHAHYEFLTAASAPFAHTNVLQRDICPSGSRFESEILAMALDLFHGEAVADHHPDETPCGAVTTGGSESIISAMVVYRDRARAEQGIIRPAVIVPTTAHPAFDKGCHLFGIDVVKAPVDPDTTQVDVGFVADHITDSTIALVGSGPGRTGSAVRPHGGPALLWKLPTGTDPDAIPAGRALQVRLRTGFRSRTGLAVTAACGFSWRLIARLS